MRQSEALAFYIADQKQLRASGGDKRMLVEALTKLTAVRHLGVVDHPGQSPEGIEIRGLQKALRTTGSRPVFTHSVPNHPGPPSNKANFDWLSHVWATTLGAIAESGISTLIGMDTDIAAGLSPIADLKFDKQMEPGISKALSNLNEMSIQIRTRNLRHGKLDSDDHSRRARHTLTAFASTLSKITTLSLGFDLDWKPETQCGRFFTAFIKGIDVSMLTNLTLDSLAIDLKRLASVVCRLASVQFLAFISVEIASGGDWTPILQVIKNLPALNHLHLMYLTVANQRVYFLEQPDTGEFTQAFAADNEDQWTEDETFDSDEELPQPMQNGTLPSEQLTTVPADMPIKAICKHDGGRDYRAPGQEHLPERGYHVCLVGQDKIQQEIPRFIEYHNIGGPSVDIIDGNLFVAGLNAALGMGGPVPGGIGNANAGGIPLPNLQALLGPPMQPGDNGQNGVAAYALPVPVGHGANLFANILAAAAPVAPQAPPTQQLLPTQQDASAQQPTAPPPVIPLQQAAQFPTQGLTPGHWAATMAGASNDGTIEEDLD